MTRREREKVLDSYQEGLLDVEDLYNLRILTFDQAADLRNQPARGVAWLLSFVDLQITEILAKIPSSG